MHNERLGVDMWQRKAMEIGSMCGWDVPGADPANYQERQAPSAAAEPNTEQMGGMSFG